MRIAAGMILMLVPFGLSAADDIVACTRIPSALQRLACFDKKAGTPLSTTKIPSTEVRNIPPIIWAVAKQESARPKGDLRFRMVESVENSVTGQKRVLISAPAVQGTRPRPILVVGCVASITRLQFIVSPAIGRNRVRVELIHDGRVVVPGQTWQVLENGRLIDAGRGLVGIDAVRRLGSGKRLEVKSDLPQLNGIWFDSEGLSGLIQTQREACRW